MPLTAAKRKRFLLDSPAEVADFFGVTEPAVRTRWIPAGMPRLEPARRKRGAASHRYPADEILTWLITEGPWRKRVDAAELTSASTATAADANQDALLAAPINTPALERYRTAKAELAEIEVAKERRQLVRSSSVITVLVAIFSWLNKLVERFSRLGTITGREAAAAVREMIAESWDVAKRELQRNAGIDSAELGSAGLESAGRSGVGDLPNGLAAGPPDQPMGGAGDCRTDGAVCREPLPTLAPSGQQDLVPGVGP